MRMCKAKKLCNLCSYRLSIGGLVIFLLTFNLISSMSCRAEDNDADGMDDSWEIANRLDPEENDAPLDPDKDNLTNIYEFLSGTNPNEKDTDRDGLDDGYEVNIAKTNPKNIDTDFDGINDCAEVLTYLTNPLSNDTDYDGLEDMIEISRGTNPRVKDTDGDGILDSDEILTDPLSFDTDLDNLNDLDEIKYRTSANHADSDGDGLKDGDEVLIIGSDPLLYDSDSDGLSDSYEVEIGLNPNSKDSDAGGLDDSSELRYGLDPKNAFDDSTVNVIRFLPIVLSILAVCIALGVLFFVIIQIRKSIRKMDSMLMDSKSKIEKEEGKENGMKISQDGKESKQIELQKDLFDMQKCKSQVAITDDTPDLIGHKRVDTPKEEKPILILDFKKNEDLESERVQYLEEHMRMMPKPKSEMRSADDIRDLSVEDILNLKVEKK